jgi:hypothetical protein
MTDPLVFYLASQVYKPRFFADVFKKLIFFFQNKFVHIPDPWHSCVNLLYKKIILLIWDQQNYLWSGIIFQFWQEGNVH